MTQNISALLHVSELLASAWARLLPAAPPRCTIRPTRTRARKCNTASGIATIDSGRIVLCSGSEKPVMRLGGFSGRVRLSALT